MLWHISDLRFGEYILGTDFEWIKITGIPDEDLKDDDGYLWAFHSRELAQAFCNGYKVFSFAFPIQIKRKP